jgi:Na+-driven multidrug efflux pump
MLHSFGVDGVAAYAVISYLIWFSFMINFGISDALQPIISKNYGANRIDRIEKLLKYAFISVFITGMIISLLLWQLPHYLAYFFLQASSSGAISIVLKFTLLIWPLFLFNGISLVVSAYFTAIHKPLPSASIAITRSLLLPVFFVLFLPLFFGDNGIYLAIPVSEFFSMFLAIGLYRRYRAKATI